MLDLGRVDVQLETETGPVGVIDGLSLAVGRGETVALVGESGCGKSLTALAVLRLLPDVGRVAGGAIRLDGDDLLDLPESRMRAVRGGRVAMIFQEPATSLNPVMRLGDQVVEAVEAHTALRGAAARAKALEWLKRVGLPEPERRFDDHAFRLSGGQKQRVMIALALAGEPDILIADEPTTALDVTIQGQILALLRELQRERGLGLLLITHDLAVVAGMAQRVALMYAGQIVELADAAAFFAAPRHPYARRLLQALPGAVPRGATLAAIPGSVPAPGRHFGGCRFAERCDLVQPRCSAAPPPLRELGGGRWLRCVLDAAAPDDPVDAAAVVQADPAAVGAARHASVLLEVEQLRVAFPVRGGLLQRVRAEHVAVDGVSFRLDAGRTLALVGESGCGKTTIGKALLQLLRGRARIEGHARWQGRDLFALQGEGLLQARRALQIVFQDPYASLDPRQRVGEALEEGLLALRPELDATARRQRVEGLIERVGLRRDALRRFPHEFSGGQRQRLAIARALAVEPSVLVCDEPTSALDVSVQAQILNLLRELQRELGLAYLFITHNLGVVEHLADAVAVMRAGRFVESGPAEAVLGAPREAYTRELLAAVPRLRG